jgi:hypothetical protein
MRAQGLAIHNRSSGALLELSTRGLKHAKTMSGDLRAALLMYKLPTALARAIYVKSETPDARKHHQQHLVAYHKFAIPGCLPPPASDLRAGDWQQIGNFKDLTHAPAP